MYRNIFFMLFKEPHCSHQIKTFLENLINSSSLVITLFQKYNTSVRKSNINNQVLTKPIFCFSKFYNGRLQSRSCQYSYFEQDLWKTPHKSEVLIILNTDMIEVFLYLLTTHGVYNVRLRIVGTTVQQLGHLRTKFPELSMEMNDTSNLTFRMMESVSLKIQEMQTTR